METQRSRPRAPAAHRRRAVPFVSGAVGALVVLGLTVPVRPGGAAQGAAGAAAAAAAPIEHHRLANGLEVLLKPEPEQQLVAVQLWYRVGARDETRGTSGYAHLFEYLMLSGTDSVPDFAAALGALGGQATSAPLADVTRFQDIVPRRHLRRVLELEADRMRNLVLTGDRIEAAADRIGIDLGRLIQTAPQPFVEDRLRALAFPGHPYANAPMGAPGAAQPVSVDSCRAFYERYYRPGNACLVVAGGFTPAAALAAIEETFGRLAGGGRAAAPSPLPPLPSPITTPDAVDLGVAAPTVAIGYPVAGAASASAASVDLLAMYLNREGRERLTAEIAADPEAPPLLGLDVYLLRQQEAGLLIVQAAFPDPAAALDVAERLRRALAQVAPRIRAAAAAATPAIAIDELRDAELFRRLSGRKTVAGRATDLATAHVVAGSYELYAHEREQLAAVTLADVAQAATSLRPEQAVVVALDAIVRQ